MLQLSNSVGETQPWVKVHALAAEHGDCIVLSYGDGKAHFRLVVDVGVTNTADRLKQVLRESDDAVWELLVVTHIDADHIGGSLALLSDKSIATRFDDIWFNGRQHLEIGREAMTVADGERLAELLSPDEISWNKAFDKGAVCLGPDDSLEYKTLPASKAVITILSPSRNGLAKLRELWDLWVQREREKEKKSIKVEKQETQKYAPNIEELSVMPPSIADLANTVSAPDKSATNGSSIAFIFEYGDFRILLGADAHADVLIKSAKKLQPEKPKLDLFKLPHHGSSANVTKNLALALPARRYLLTTNGERHSTHPSDGAIGCALNASPDAELFFNYPNEAYKRWFGWLPEHKVHVGKSEEGICVCLDVRS